MGLGVAARVDVAGEELDATENVEIVLDSIADDASATELDVATSELED